MENNHLESAVTALSIITPVYNGRRFIEACICNVIDQQCPAVEHIIVDGSSTDGTAEVIKRYAEKYPHIRWISENDNGQSDAMNKGIRMAEGSIIGFLNYDDYYVADVLNRILALSSNLVEPSLVVGNCNCVDEHNTIQYVNKPKKLQLKDLLLGYDVNPFPINPSAYFYHRSLHDKVGYYKTDENFVMDIDFLLRAVTKAHVVYFDEVWGNHRRHAAAKTVQTIIDGSIKVREHHLMETTLSALPVHERIWISLKRYYYYKIKQNRFYARVKRYLSNPSLVIERMKSRRICKRTKC